MTNGAIPLREQLVGLSIDGPEDVHNANRVDKKGSDTYKEVIRGLNILRKYKVEFNTLTCVNSETVKHPVKIYKFLKSIGSKYLQFIPIVEREVIRQRLSLILPPHPTWQIPPNLKVSTDVRACSG